MFWFLPYLVLGWHFFLSITCRNNCFFWRQVFFFQTLRNRNNLDPRIRIRTKKKPGRYPGWNEFVSKTANFQIWLELSFFTQPLLLNINKTRTISVHSSEAFKNIKPEYCVLVCFMYRIEFEIIYKECKICSLEVMTDILKISNFWTGIMRERSVLEARLIFQKLS